MPWFACSDLLEYSSGVRFRRGDSSLCHSRSGPLPHVRMRWYVMLHGREPGGRSHRRLRRGRGGALVAWSTRTHSQTVRHRSYRVRAGPWPTNTRMRLARSVARAPKAVRERLGRRVGPATASCSLIANGDRPPVYDDGRAPSMASRTQKNAITRSRAIRVGWTGSSTRSRVTTERARCRRGTPRGNRRCMFWLALDNILTY